MCSVEYHDVPYVAPGMVPPGPVWLTLKPREKKKRRKSLSSGLPRRRRTSAREEAAAVPVQLDRARAREGPGISGAERLRRKMAEAAKEAEVNDGGDDADASSRRARRRRRPRREAEPRRRRKEMADRNDAPRGAERAPLGELLVECTTRCAFPRRRSRRGTLPESEGRRAKTGGTVRRTRTLRRIPGRTSRRTRTLPRRVSDGATKVGAHRVRARRGRGEAGVGAGARLLELGYAVASGREGRANAERRCVGRFFIRRVFVRATGSPFALRPGDPILGALAAETDGDDAAERLE